MSSSDSAVGDGADSAPTSVSLREALPYWLTLGFVSFGGPAGQIATMHAGLVERRRWISERRFLHALNYCMVLPGPEAQQLATYIGWLMHGTLGGVVAGGLFVLPSFFILVALTWVYLAFGEVPAVAGFLYGIKPAVTAIVIFAAYRIGSRALKNAALWAIAALAFVAIFFLNIPFPAIVLTAGIIGLIGGRVAPATFAVGGGHGAGAKRYGAALIDDDTPPPPHARHGLGHFAMVLAVFLALWAAALAAVIGIFGWDAPYARMGWFFTKAALLTFGGAYAVLPYVYQGGVETYGWLTAIQMIDGLALGWTKEVFGPDALFLAGLSGAAVATFFTFLPSFLLILVGGPLVESTHGNVKFTAPLTGITAAVVGVVLNLAAFFAWHVLWPRASPGAPFLGPFDWFALIVTIAALIALYRFRTGMIPVILGCGAAGLAIHLTRTI
jgi:chromate transporter